MPTHGPFYPTVISGDGWTNPHNAKQPGGGVATTDGYPDLNASGFNASIPTGVRIVRARIGVNASSTHTGFTSPSLDNVQLTKGGYPIGDQQGHINGIPGGWAEFDADVDLSAEFVNADDFGMVASFWDSLDEPTGSHTISVDTVRITLFSE